MAIFSAGSLASSISGALGGVVFANTKGSKVVRHRPTPTRYSQEQHPSGGGSPRGAFQICARYWQSMTDAQRQAWRTIANQTPWTNRLGQQRQLTGFQLFMKWNLATWIAVGAPRATAPQSGTVDNVTQFDLNFAEGGPFNIDWDYASDTNAQGFIIYGRTHFATIAPQFQGHLRAVALYINTGGPDTIDIYNDWIAVLPEPVEDQAVTVAIRSFAGDYLPSPYLYDSTIVTA